MPVETISISRIVADPACQPRQQVDFTAVDEYGEAMRSGTVFPPVDAVRDGDAFYLYDGFHRLQATQRIGRSEITVNWQPGTRLDAIEKSCAVNSSHGIRRTNTDKRRAVETMFRVMVERGDDWSDGEVAYRCGVSQRFVTSTNYRPLTQNGSESKPRVGRDGRTINTANIGRRPAFDASQVEQPAGQVGAVIDIPTWQPAANPYAVSDDDYDWDDEPSPAAPKSVANTGSIDLGAALVIGMTSQAQSRIAKLTDRTEQITHVITTLERLIPMAPNPHAAAMAEAYVVLKSILD